MDKHSRIVPLVRLIISFIGICAIITQLVVSITSGRNLFNFFSFFTIESNIMAVILYFYLGVRGITRNMPRSISMVRGAITLYMTLTGIIYMLLLSGNEVALQTTVGWVNLILHYALPLIILLDWLFFPPKTYIPSRRAVLWLVFPAIYLIYSLIRGSVTHWYPYPFINPIINGWPTVVVMSIFIGFTTIILSLTLGLRTRQFRPKVSM